MSRYLTQQELETYLWGAATLLRGLVNATDYKQFIFPLLFFKRLSDVWGEDYQTAFAETNDKGYASATANDRFTIPFGARWGDVRSLTKDIGSGLVTAFRAIETANPKRLHGVFGNAAWTDKEQMPDVTIKNLIEHFSTNELTLTAVPEDELGNGYEYLIKKFADDSGHTAQEFYTNRTLVHLMAQMLKPQSGESIYDPTCGTGGMLISCLAEAKRNGNDTRTMGLYGQELIAITASIARMNLVLHGVSDFKVASGNTLSAPGFVSDDAMQRFDVVLANPPYSISNWNRDAWSTDQWGRNFLGTPPQGRADYAFFQHILYSMKPKSGRSATLFPHGVLERHDEAEIRRRLIDTDMIECVLGLGPGLFYNSPMEACVVICQSEKAADRKGKILFINAFQEIARERSQSFLRLENQKRILDAYHNFVDVPGFAAVADLAAVDDNNGNLSIIRYVKPIKAAKTDEEKKSLLDSWDEFEAGGQAFWGEMGTVVDMLDGIDDEDQRNG